LVPACQQRHSRSIRRLSNLITPWFLPVRQAPRLANQRTCLQVGTDFPDVDVKGSAHPTHESDEPSLLIWRTDDSNDLIPRRLKDDRRLSIRDGKGLNRG